MDSGAEGEGQDGYEDHILLPMSGATFHNGQGKPSQRRTFEMAIGARSDSSLNGMIQRLLRRFGVADRCSQINIKKLKVSLSVKNFKLTPEFPKGRLFDSDSEEQ